VFSDSSPLTPLSKACLGLAGLLAALLIAVVVNYLAHGGADGLASTSIAAAAVRTSAEPGGSLETEVTFGVAGESKTVTATGSGVFDAASGRARIEQTTQGADGAPLKVETLSDEKRVFVRSSVLAEELPPHKEWLGMEPLLGKDPSTALGAGGGAKGSLEMLQAIGSDVEAVGEETIRGEATTRYKATVDLSKAAKTFAAKGDTSLAHLYREIASRLAGPMPTEVWIGVGGLVRRQRMIERTRIDGGKILELHVSIDYFDFAPHPDIKLPASETVLDYTPVLRAELGMIDGTSLGPLTPPAGATPLAVSSFRNRAAGICKEIRHKVTKLVAAAPPFAQQLKAVGPRGIAAGEAKPILVKVGLWYEGPLYRLSVRATSEFAALDPPARYAADYRRYLTMSVEEAEWLLAKARSYQLGAFDVPGVDEQRPAEARRSREFKRLEAAMGIDACTQDAEGPSGQAAETTLG
jgi:hypothetical protein